MLRFFTTTLPGLVSVISHAHLAAAKKPRFDSTGSGSWWVDIGVSVGCCFMAALMTALNIGLLAQDPLSLEVLSKTGTPREKKYASRIRSLLTRQNWCIAALLVMNAVAVEVLPLFMDHMVDSWIAIIISSVLVLLCTDIVPTAIASLHGLRLAGSMTWVVRMLMYLTSPITLPLSWALDYMLGRFNVFSCERMLS